MTDRGAARTAALVALPIALIAGLVAFWRLGGFDGRSGAAPRPVPSTAMPSTAMPRTAVPMPAPGLDARPAELCRALLTRIPQALRDLPRRPVTAGVAQNAAYGEPPVTVACGGTPPAVAPEAAVFLLDGVCWLSAQRPDATVWTVLGRETPVAVTVPRAYPGPAQWVIEFSTPVAAAIPPAGAPPAGCVPR